MFHGSAWQLLWAALHLRESQRFVEKPAALMMFLHIREKRPKSRYPGFPEALRFAEDRRREEN
jgi:hypothetical protein